MPRFVFRTFGATVLAVLFGLFLSQSSWAQDTGSKYSTKRYLMIISVECISTTLGGDTDDIYFSVSNGKRFPLASEAPFHIREGQFWEPGFFVTADEPLDIALMEADFIGSDDRIGLFRYDPANAVGRYSETMKGDFSEYKVVFEFR